MPARRKALWLSLLGSVCLLSSFVGCNTMSGYTMNRAGTAAYRRGNYALAQANFQRAIFDNPNNPDYYSNLASVMRKNGDYHRSEQMYQQALRMNRSHQPAYHGLASLLMETGRQQEAISLIDGWATTQPYLAQAHIEQGWIKREVGDTLGAEQSMRQALQIQPNNAVALAHLGQIYQDRGDNRNAVAFYQYSLRSDFSQPQVQARLSQLRGHRRSNTLNTQMANNSFYVFPGDPQLTYLPRNSTVAQGQPTPVALAPQPTPVNSSPQPTPVANQPGPSPTQPAPIAIEHPKGHETTFLAPGADMRTGHPQQMVRVPYAPQLRPAPMQPVPQTFSPAGRPMQLGNAPQPLPASPAPPLARHPLPAAFPSSPTLTVTPAKETAGPQPEPIIQTSAGSSSPGPILFAPNLTEEPAPLEELPTEEIPLVEPH